MNTNPYADLLETMEQAAAMHTARLPMRFYLARVITTNPISLDVCGTTQEASRVGVCSHLMAGYATRMTPSGNLNISASCPYGSHGSMSVGGGTLNLTLAQNVLKAGDEVVVMTSDNQKFILFDKVVYQ